MDVNLHLHRRLKDYYRARSAQLRQQRQVQEQVRRQNEVAEAYSKAESGIEYENLTNAQRQCVDRRFPGSWVQRKMGEPQKPTDSKDGEDGRYRTALRPTANRANSRSVVFPILQVETCCLRLTTILYNIW